MKNLDKKPQSTKSWFELQVASEDAAKKLEDAFTEILAQAKTDEHLKHACQYNRPLRVQLETLSSQCVKLNEAVAKSRLAMYLLWFADNHGPDLYSEFFNQRGLATVGMNLKDTELKAELVECSKAIEKQKAKDKKDKEDRAKKNSYNNNTRYTSSVTRGRGGAGRGGRGGGHPSYYHYPPFNVAPSGSSYHSQWPNYQNYQNKKPTGNPPYSQFVPPGFGPQQGP